MDAVFFFLWRRTKSNASYSRKKRTSPYPAKDRGLVHPYWLFLRICHCPIAPIHGVLKIRLIHSVNKNVSQQLAVIHWDLSINRLFYTKYQHAPIGGYSWPFFKNVRSVDFFSFKQSLLHTLIPHENSINNFSDKFVLQIVQFDNTVVY